MYILVIYDISEKNNGSRRSRKVFKECKKYLFRTQKSAFEGEMTEAQLRAFKASLEKILDLKLDVVTIYKSRNARWLDKINIGTNAFIENRDELII